MKELDTIRKDLLDARKSLEGIANANWRDFGDGLNSLEEFELWARSRARYTVNYINEALAALSTIDPEAGTGWMIEKSSGIPMWWRGLPKRDGLDSWSTDPLQGIRFVRKVDAEVCALAQGYKLSAVKATDHRWGLT